MGKEMKLVIKDQKKEKDKIHEVWVECSETFDQIEVCITTNSNGAQLANAANAVVIKPLDNGRVSVSCYDSDGDMKRLCTLKIESLKGWLIE